MPIFLTAVNIRKVDLGMPITALTALFAFLNFLFLIYFFYKIMDKFVHIVHF